MKSTIFTSVNNPASYAGLKKIRYEGVIVSRASLQAGYIYYYQSDTSLS
jgi:hypothetical protein